MRLIVVNELARAAWDDKSRVSYHCHNGKHDLVSDDWKVYLAHAENVGDHCEQSSGFSSCCAPVSS